MNIKALWLIVAILTLSENTFAQTDDREPVAVIEVGGAAARNLKDAVAAGGATIAVEVTPIENWLELEAGTTRLSGHGSTEWDTDLLFKKPWNLGRKTELMLGAGPEWVRTSQNGATSNTVAVEVVADFMFWPSAKRRFGWYLEPGFEYNHAAGRERSIGITGGLLIAIRKH
jgi:hypothetical protein